MTENITSLIIMVSNDGINKMPLCRILMAYQQNHPLKGGSFAELSLEVVSWNDLIKWNYP